MVPRCRNFLYSPQGRPAGGHFRRGPATHPDHADPIAVVATTPPVTVMQQIPQTASRDDAVMMLLLGIRKITGLAVRPEHRRAGLGRLMLLQATTLAHRTGAIYVYGQTRTRDGLIDWYRRCGFKVLPPSEGLDLAWLIDMPFGIKPMLGEQLFVSDM